MGETAELTSTLRPIAVGERRAYAEMLVDAFLEPALDDTVTAWEDLCAAGDFHGVHEDDRLLGGAGVLHRTWTVPGGYRTPVAAVTGVAVAPDARGRGFLRRLVEHQLHRAHDTGAEPVAALWASQGGLYRRFGYDVASRRADLTVPTATALRADLPVAGSVRAVDAEEAAPAMRRVQAATCRRPGRMSRSEQSWSWWLGEPPAHGGPAGRLRHLLHLDRAGDADGYATFRVDTGGDGRTVDVLEVLAVGPEAELSLWRHLLGLDLADRVRHRLAPVDHPLQHWVDDPRRIGLTIADALWVRLVDVDRALVARALASRCDVVIEVADDVCGWNCGRWRLRGDPDSRPVVGATDRSADVSCDVTVLAAAYLGDVTVRSLARAGRVVERRPGAVDELSRALAWDDVPHTDDVF